METIEEEAAIFYTPFFTRLENHPNPLIIMAYTSLNFLETLVVDLKENSIVIF